MCPRFPEKDSQAQEGAPYRGCGLGASEPADRGARAPPAVRTPPGWAGASAGLLLVTPGPWTGMKWASPGCHWVDKTWGPSQAPSNPHTPAPPSALSLQGSGHHARPGVMVWDPGAQEGAPRRTAGHSFQVLARPRGLLGTEDQSSRCVCRGSHVSSRLAYPLRQAGRRGAPGARGGRRDLGQVSGREGVTIAPMRKEDLDTDPSPFVKIVSKWGSK